MFTDASLDPSLSEYRSTVLPEVSIIRKERNCQGMLECKKEDQSKLLKAVITGSLIHINVKMFNRLCLTPCRPYLQTNQRLLVADKSQVRILQRLQIDYV